MIDLLAWRAAEARLSDDLLPILAAKRVEPLWRATNISVHVLYSSCAQHGLAAPCSHTEDEHVLMWLGGRVLTNTLAALRLLVAGYYGPSVALVRDSVETTMLLGLFDAVPEELSVWRTMTDSKARWKQFSPSAVKKKLTARKAWHRYRDYDLYTGMAGHPLPTSSPLSFSEKHERRMVGPFADASNAHGTLHAIAVSASHGAYQIADLLKLRDRFAVEFTELNDALDAWARGKD